ncbi:E3 ubiquitin-protein ligase rnf213-alpha-like, partial [Dendronephthya gigantea]|uniref:E3 ubiquitin-protein ligase rnf213-alpha-like n=1 Tax=Dendronephthya gigantea TaxID=151771 RepID=UPI00106BCDE9
MGKNKKGKKKKNRGKNKHNGKMSSQKETHETDRGRKRLLSFEEVAPKRQKCTADKQQFHEGNVGQASNTETSHMHIPPEVILNEKQRPSERQYPFQVKGNIQQYTTNEHGIGVHGIFPLLKFWFSTQNMNGDINHALRQIPKLTLDAQQFDTLLQWVIDCTNLDHLHPMQGLYLCYVLGHLMPPYGLQIPQSEQVKCAFDKLLGCLAECAKYNCFNMSFSFCQPLEQLSRILVENCSYPGWLTLVVYFYPYYRDTKRLLQFQMAHLNYELSHYNYLLSLLLPNIEKVNWKSQLTLRELLKMVLQSAPEGHDLFRLCEDKNMKKCFFTEKERLKFFADCYLERLQSNENNSTIGEVLKKLLIIPAKIRNLKWGSLYEYLRRFAKSDAHLTDEDIADFQQLTLHLPKEQSHDILMFLSKSSSPRRQNMVLEFLKSPKFESKWKSLPLKKVAIGKSWLIRKLETAADEKNHGIAGNMVLTAHCLFKDFISCLPVRENKTMFSELGKTVRNWLLENVDYALIIKESGEISNVDLPSDVRSNLFKLVDEVLRQNFNLVNTKETMNNFYNSSFRSQLFKCVLDSLEIPNYEKKQYSPTEKNFLTMLQYCEIWIALFRTERDFERESKFRNGKRIWQNLASCLEKEEISVEFLSLVAKYENELSLLLAYAVQRTPQENIDSRQQHNLTMIKNLVEKERVVREKLSCLESAIKFAKAINSVQFPQILNEKREHLKTKILKDLNDDFWGPLLPLLELSSKLEPVMDSVSFRNIAEDCVKNISTYSSDDDDTKALYLLFTLLTTETIQQFKEKWKKLSDDPESQTFETMKILEGIRDEEDLKKELSILEKNLSPQLIPDNLRQYMLDYVKYESVQKDVCVTFKALDTFKLRKPNNNLVATLTKFEEEFKPDSSICLQQLHEPMADVQGIIGEYLNENDYDVIDVLGQSSELIEFLKEIIHVDIRILIDAVEEHSDQFVSESLVSELIHVHGFLAPVIEVCQNNASGDQLPQHVLQEIKNQCEDNENMAVKIHQCNAHVHSLQQLYHSVANRGEVTREIITHCLTKGYACISLEEEGVCKIEIKYKKKDESEASYILSDLRDLRSRAHLIVSPDRSWKHSSENDESMEQRVNFVDFIDQVNILCDIEELILKLLSSGYIKYQTMNKVTLTGVEELQEKKKELQDELCDWEKSLDDARRQHHFLNYYWSDQLCVLYNFLTNRNRSEVDFENLLTLIRFVDSNIEEQYLRDYGEKQSENHSKNQQNNSECNPDEIILIIGNALDEIFAKTRPTERAILKDQTSCFEHQQNSEVQPGELYVVALKKNSTAPTINVVLSLYENTLNTYPELNQIIFCDANKQWREIKLFLRRCFARNKPFQNKTLFCLANVELLENEVQFNLIEFIKAERKNNPNYLLAIICRGGDDHHIIEEFSQFSHRIPGMSNPEISQRFRSSWPDVKFVTSTLPGLGKTEFIREEALEKEMNVVTFPISGQFDQSKIIRRLKQIHLRNFQCLHFDIGEVDDPILLDTFLFQLIVTGMVSCGTQLYSLRNTHVYIEVANSLNDRLCESLVISQSFTCKELKWDDYKNLKVSKKTTSDIQVVCQYLDVFDRNRLESTDVRFKGQQRVESLPANRCHELLRKYYLTSSETTFTALNTFLGLLANQLRNFSKSSFFMTHNIKYMVEQKQKGVRRNLFEALLEVSKNFAARALNTCSARYHLLEADTQSNTIAEHMIGRVEEMIHWEQNNHLLIVFHGNNSQAITAFYRKKEDVPPKVSDLLKNQIVKEANKELEDFELMNQQQLQEKLEKIVRTESRGAEEGSTLENESSGYALTPDNMLKMILIILRMRANVPIIIMGETGCGKTSLIKYLANICEIPFFAFNIHAGRSEEEIKEFVKERDKAANENPNQNFWVFLDEINTCGHLGLINGILCHHLMGGQPLATNLVFIAACNPYKRRTEDHILTAGLEMNNMKDEYSKLVYRVHPLPEAMVDYVWDYGSLTPHDEKEYIKRMIQSLPGKYLDVLAELIAESQRFIRESEDNPYCVSLRDVRRYVLLVEWFINMIEDRGRFSRRDGDRYQEHLRKYRDVAQQFDTEPVLKSIILALAHCYLSRLETDELRRRYQERVTQVFATMANVSVEEFSAIIRMEQEDYLDRMELPSGTARNAALRENVFVMLVSILNRIPVFVVGKPGCSKSLAIQLIRSSLRGKDSRDPFFKTLPQLYVVSYQGSESSTSEGITKIFEKASNYKKHNKEANVLPVVLLDEVGLAENSPNNPLKVLHSILEPGKGELPEVAVVGISNWALDAAKMNRAIHLSRPEPTVKDLEETAISLYQAQRNSTEKMNTSSSSVMNCLAKSYHEYLSQQGHANFHGLRDYYSLIKSLGPNSCDDMDKIHLALHRNFGGIPAESSKVQQIFVDKIKFHVPTSREYVRIPVTALIQENLDDLKARHLMLITNGDSAIGILKQNLSQSAKETITIFGSRFEEDVSDDYNYRMLSRIILYMERDCILILRDLECIYGSLYDMLNQNYSVVGKRKNCRVALGANSNPMCYVNDGFRCIVLVDQDKVDYSDPPFLNRFEKQLLRFSDVLNENQKEIIEELESWVEQMSCVEDLDEQFKKSDMFMGFHEDTLPSLVLLHSNDTDESNEEIVKKCKDDLMWIATPDGVLRTQKCEHVKENPREVNMLTKEYFEKPLHNGLASFIAHVVEDEEFSYLTGEDVGSKTIVMTYATVHTDIANCLDDT